MKRVYIVILIASALLLGAAKAEVASLKPRSNQHKKAAAKLPNSAQQQEEKEFLSVLQSSQTAFLDALRAIEHQAEAERKQTHPEPETYASPSVRVQIGLLVVGVIYSVLAALQWCAIRAQAKLGKDALIETRRAIEIAHRAKLSMRAEISQAEISYELANSGQMPATEVTVSIFKNQTDLEGFFRAPQDRWRGQVIAPNGTYKRTIPLRTGAIHRDAIPILTQNELDEATARKSVSYTHLTLPTILRV